MSHVAMPPVASSGDAVAARRALYRQAFALVDTQKAGRLNLRQSKDGLKRVFELLGDVPMPSDAWYALAFGNFDFGGQGRIDFAAFQDIVEQWWQYNHDGKF